MTRPRKGINLTITSMVVLFATLLTALLVIGILSGVIDASKLLDTISNSLNFINRLAP